jgi:protein SCO1/2|nr:MAG: SCO1/SenC family protein [Bacteroidota bacterium]
MRTPLRIFPVARCRFNRPDNEHTGAGSVSRDQPLFAARNKQGILLRVGLPVIGFLLAACGRGPAVEADLTRRPVELLDQDSTVVVVPDAFRGQIVLVGYIYTHCPDICPMITARMLEIARHIPDSLLVRYVLVSFDPERDRPHVLRHYARVYELPESWRLLTGPESELQALLDLMGVRTRRSWTSFAENGEPVYFIDHTDRISLLDGRGRVRRHYEGTTADPERVRRDVLTLWREATGVEL